jgi:hypothetical protein
MTMYAKPCGAKRQQKHSAFSPLGEARKGVRIREIDDARVDLRRSRLYPAGRK